MTGLFFLCPLDWVRSTFGSGASLWVDCLVLLRVDRGLSGSQAGDRHAEGRAGHVVQADVVAELDARRIAAVLAADAEVQVRAGLAAERVAAILTSLPTPTWSRRANGSFS